MGKAENIISQVLERMLPVGSIVEWSPVEGDKADLSSADKVAAYYGFGTWEAYGSGRMLLGVSESHAVGSAEGNENHKLTVDELPDAQIPVDICITSGASGGTNFARFAYNGISSASNAEFLNGGKIEKLGGGRPISIMPPYITVYRWRRIA